jgi:hypothetical protein
MLAGVLGRLSAISTGNYPVLDDVSDVSFDPCL